MAARRLIVVMLALLLLSTVLAVVAPVRPSEEQSTSTTTTATPPPTAIASASGSLVRERVEVGGRKPARVELAQGDQLELVVAYPSRGPGALAEPDQVEIRSLNLIEDIGRDAPARFSLLLANPGIHPVRLAESGRRVAWIEVAAAE